MSCNGYSKIWELAPRELVGLADGQGTTLRVTRGTLWLTFEHDTRDVVLKPGDIFTIDRGGLTLIAAHGATTVCVLARQVEPIRMRAGRLPLTTRVRRWLESLPDAGLARGWAPYV